MPAPEGRFVAAALERFWELRGREGRSHELRRQLEAILEREGASAPLDQLQELLVLMLYWGTALDVREIALLRRSQLQSAEMGRFKVSLERRGGAPTLQVLPAETSAALRLFLGRAPQGDDLLLRDPAGRPYAETELFDLVQRHASGLLLGATATEDSGFLDHPVVLPTATRLRAHPRYTGKGVTIAFVDSGFHAHPDLVRPHNRILEYVDLTGRGRKLAESPDDAWHGTMTSVCCAGNGMLSNGLYRGIARDARLVLLAVGRDGRIRPADIERALEWLLEHRARLDLKIVNISLAGDDPESFRDSRIDEAAELLVQAGIVVVAAAGNDPLRPSLPPANSPSVITVGGLVDKNLPHEMTFVAYRSQYGTTRDGLMKPELVAPGALVAVPILPGTPTFAKARLLYFSRALPDGELRTELARHPELDFAAALPELDDEALRERVEREIRALKLVGPHYQHADGTSFAAPIVASVVAQMLEATPGLRPDAVRDLLIRTARPIPHIPRERQGYGLVQPLEAVQAAESPDLPALARSFAEPRIEGGRARFHFRAEHQGQVCVAGSFNAWNGRAQPMLRTAEGGWEASVALPLPGRHSYKFVVDGQYWVEDPANPRTEPDGYGGLNSVFETAEHAFAAELPGRVFDTLHAADTTPEDRALALSALDFALGLPNAAWNAPVLAYYQRCLETALKRLAGPAPERGVEIIQLYNCGVVVRSAHASVGIDVVSGRHVWGLDWRIAEPLVQQLADALDVLLVTQRLPDHLDLDLVRLLLARGRVVGVPEEVRASIADACLGFAPGATRRLEIGGAPLVVRAHRAAHWWDEDDRVCQRAWDLELGGVRVVHLADHDPLRFLDMSGSPDVLLATLGRFSPDSGPREALAALRARMTPRLLVPTHVAELGQPGYGDEDGYDAVTQWLTESAGTLPWRILTWGESLP